MLKRLIKSVREFKLPTILTLIFIVAEVVIEVFIPFITALLISYIQTPTKNPLRDIPILQNIAIPTGETVRMEVILGFGGVLVLMAMLSLACGGIAAYTCRREIFDRTFLTASRPFPSRT